MHGARKLVLFAGAFLLRIQHLTMNCFVCVFVDFLFVFVFVFVLFCWDLLLLLLFLYVCCCFGSVCFVLFVFVFVLFVFVFVLLLFCVFFVLGFFGVFTLFNFFRGGAGFCFVVFFSPHIFASENHRNCFIMKAMMIIIIMLL